MISMGPMLCESARRVPRGSEWILEPKWDGHRILMRLDEEDRFDTRTRSGRGIAGKLPVIERELKRCVPSETTLDGEVVILAKDDDGRFLRDVGAVQSVMGANGPDADGILSFVIFDLLELAGEDMMSRPWWERREELEAIINPSHHVQITPAVPASEKTHLQLLELGFEGSVAKRVQSVYRPGRRHRDWLKVKAVETLDVIVMALPHDGKDGFKGLVGALRFGLLDTDGQPVELGRCSGMSAAERYDMTHHPERWLGKVIEISHLGVTPNGSLRSAQYVRLRPDLELRDLANREFVRP